MAVEFFDDFEYHNIILNRYYKRRVRHMQTIEAYYDGRAFVPVTPVAVRVNERAVITIFDDITANCSKRENEKAYLSYAGALSDENYDEIMEIIKETGQIDANGW